MTMQTHPTIAIRPATAGDGPALSRLAALDSAPVPYGQVLLAEADGELRAALDVRTGAAVADPFRPTAELVSLLRDHAARLTPSGAVERHGLLGAARRARLAL